MSMDLVSKLVYEIDSCLNEAYDMLKRGIKTKTVYLPGLDLDGQGKSQRMILHSSIMIRNLH